MHNRLITRVLGVGLFGLALMLSPAHAGTILVFGQNSLSNDFTATTTGSTGAAGGTTLSADNVAVTITGIANVVPLPGSYPEAFLNLGATSSSNAVVNGSGQIVQDFSGWFSITSLANGGGTDYLSGTFHDAVFGSGTGLGLTASGPSGVPTLTSDVIANLAQMRAISLSFTDLTPVASITANQTLGAFSSNVSGSFSAAPEPASVILLAVGAAGLWIFGSRFRPTANA